MMLNVSRTRVPESWLSNLATMPSVGYNALDEALVTLEKSRFSVSTIDSELFPELLSWSALMNALPPSSCAQSIPRDITKPGEVDTDTDTDTEDEGRSSTLLETDLSLSLILDPTTLEVGFDQSCFDGLDDLLIHHPFESFTESCWLDIAGPSSPSIRPTTPTQLLNKPAGRRKLPPTPLTQSTPTKCDVDVDDCLTYYRGERTSTPIEIDVTSNSPPPYSKQMSSCSKTDKYLSSIFSDDDATSFILFEAPLLTPHRYDSVGRFPIPSSRPQKKPFSGISTFCSNLPASFTYVR